MQRAPTASMYSASGMLVEVHHFLWLYHQPWDTRPKVSFKRASRCGSKDSTLGFFYVSKTVQLKAGCKEECRILMEITKH